RALGSRTRDPRTDPCRVPSAPAPPGCRSPSACRSCPPPARSACLPASRSSQQLDDLPKRPRRDLAADTHPSAAAELNLDKPSALHPTPARERLRLRHNLDRHHRAALGLRTRFLRQQLPPPINDQRQALLTERLQTSPRSRACCSASTWWTGHLG